jgi:predicted RecA/RadA family phage recombinase
MPARFVRSARVLNHIPKANVAPGDVIVQGDLVSIARRKIQANRRGSLAVSGVFDIPKATGPGTTIAIGTKVYWDLANKVATANENGGANKYVGKAIKNAPETAAVVRVLLSQ